VNREFPGPARTSWRAFRKKTSQQSRVQHTGAFTGHGSKGAVSSEVMARQGKNSEKKKSPRCRMRCGGPGGTSRKGHDPSEEGGRGENSRPHRGGRGVFVPGTAALPDRCGGWYFGPPNLSGSAGNRAPGYMGAKTKWSFLPNPGRKPGGQNESGQCGPSGLEENRQGPGPWFISNNGGQPGVNLKAVTPHRRGGTGKTGRIPAFGRCCPGGTIHGGRQGDPGPRGGGGNGVETAKPITPVADR